MSYQDEFGKVLPPVDINGDTHEFIPRDWIWDEIAGLYKPVADKIPFDLATWWPEESDSLCLATRAPSADSVGLPYSTTTLRRVSFITRLEPDLVHIPMRFGTAAVTTTTMKAHWDCGIRRILFEFDFNNNSALLLKIGKTPSRLIPLSANDPRKTRDVAYIMDLSQRPDVDDPIEWYRRDNV
jgi:hypothetical protein